MIPNILQSGLHCVLYVVKDEFWAFTLIQPVTTHGNNVFETEAHSQSEVTRGIWQRIHIGSNSIHPQLRQISALLRT